MGASPVTCSTGSAAAPGPRAPALQSPCGPAEDVSRPRPEVAPVRLPRRRLLRALPAALAAGTLLGLCPAGTPAARAAPVATLQAERLALPAAAGQVFADPAAAGGAGLLVWSDASASGSVTTTAATDRVRVVARGDQCGGAPVLRLTVDGVAAGTATVSSTTWAAYTVRVPRAAGAHSVAVAFVNDTRTATCDRNLRLDRISLLAPAATPGPWGGLPLYVDPASDAVREAAARRSWDPRGAALLDKIGGSAGALWLGDWQSRAQVTDSTRRRVAAAASQGRVPLLVAYALPHRDCGGYSAGGVPDAAAYGAWVRALADGIGQARAVVVLEPDSIAQLDCLTAQRRDERLAALRDAVAVLAARPGAVVYLDGGNSGWVPAEEMARRLVRAGLASARGFATNVSNFHTTPTEVAYAERLSALTSGSRYVVDTSRNGLGPLSGAAWCNPAGRALGVRPTTVTGAAHADAYLWVKRVGESDGDCGRGEPPAGTWWTSYALGLASRAAW